MDIYIPDDVSDEDVEIIEIILNQVPEISGLSDRGIEAHHIEGPDNLDATWFAGKHHVGITAGTSTPQDVIEAVHAKVRQLVGQV